MRTPKLRGRRFEEACGRSWNPSKVLELRFGTTMVESLRERATAKKQKMSHLIAKRSCVESRGAAGEIAAEGGDGGQHERGGWPKKTEMVPITLLAAAYKLQLPEFPA